MARPKIVAMRGFEEPVSPFRPDARPASSNCIWFLVMPAVKASFSCEKPRSVRAAHEAKPQAQPRGDHRPQPRDDGPPSGGARPLIYGAHGEHMRVSDERWEQADIARRSLRPRLHCCTHLCAMCAAPRVPRLTHMLPTTRWALTSRARPPVRVTSRPAGALTSFAFSRPQGAVLCVFLDPHLEHPTSAPRSQVTSTRPQPTQDRSPSSPASPA